MATRTAPANLIYTMELTRWTKYREFVSHLESLMACAQHSGSTLIVEIWSFPDKRKEQPTEAGTAIKD